MTIGGEVRVRGLKGGAPVALDLAAGAYGCLLGGVEDGGAAVLRALAREGQGRMLVAGGGRPALAFGRVIDRIQGRAGATGVVGRRQAAALAESFGLDPARPIATLDGAAWRRLRLAGAIVARPALLLLDDPLAGDAEALALGEVLRAACREAGIGVLHATARREEAFAIADTVFLLRRGVVLQRGTPAQLYERPVSLESALRSGAGTALPGTIVSVEEEQVTVQLRDGPIIAAAAPDAAEGGAGRACHVLLRPERIAISVLAVADLGGDAIAGVIRASAHLGDVIRLTVAIGTDSAVVVCRPSALGTRGLTVGRTVSLAWQAHHVPCFLDGAFHDNGA